ncbi:MAG: GGDEF domain-containing protein, partial [Spirochaetia bacterium]|nr:GGDEF domain-containing protein [Spirochaetia bacterium]
ETIEQVLKQKVPYWERKVLEGKQTEFEFHLGQKFLHADFYPISNDAQEVVGSVTLIKDVTVLKERSDWLKSKAEKDSLTGLYNRQTFIEKVETELERTFSEVHLLYFDLDHFKMVNDKYGHRAGDLLLAEVGKLSQQTGCVAGRMGGEEFALFSAVHNRQKMEELAEELRISVASLNLVHEGKEIHATISAGLASLTNPSFDQIYHLADSLLYQAKREGRNCVRF